MGFIFYIQSTYALIPLCWFFIANKSAVFAIPQKATIIFNMPIKNNFVSNLLILTKGNCKSLKAKRVIFVYLMPQVEVLNSHFGDLIINIRFISYSRILVAIKKLHIYPKVAHLSHKELHIKPKTAHYLKNCALTMKIIHLPINCITLRSKEQLWIK